MSTLIVPFPVVSSSRSPGCNWRGQREVRRSTEERVYRKNAITDRDKEMGDVEETIKNQRREVGSNPIRVCWEKINP